MYSNSPTYPIITFVVLFVISSTRMVNLEFSHEMMSKYVIK